MLRKQIEERVKFSKSEKTKILEKSKNRCCRCGSLLDENSMTIEHIIPLSRGGTNQQSNLVALCWDCNQKKDNYILHPGDYFPYLEDEHYQNALTLYKGYIEDVSWYGTRNYTKEEMKVISYYMPLTEHIRKKKNGEKIARKIRLTATLQKIRFKELEEVYKFVEDYNKSEGLDCSDVKDVVDSIFKRGCMYKIHKNNNTIAILPFTIETFYTDTGLKHYSLNLNGLPCKYKKHEYKQLIVRSIMYVLNCISELNYLRAATTCIDVPTSDLFLKDIVENYMRGTICGYDKDKTWAKYSVSYICKDSVEEDGYNLNYDAASNKDPDKILQIFSDGLQRCLKLPSLNKEQERKEKNQKARKEMMNKKIKSTKKKQYRLEIDEYDPHYYV